MIKSINEKLIVRSVEEKDCGKISSLANLRFGDGYLDIDEFHKWLTEPDLFLLAEYEGNFAGYTCLRPETPKEIAESMQLDVNEVTEFAKGKGIVHCRSCALVKEYEHNGIMKALVETELENAKNDGYGSAYAPAWMYNGYVPMKKTMEFFNFDAIAIKKNLWYNDLKYVCIVCGGRCRCDGLIYRKSL